MKRPILAALAVLLISHSLSAQPAIDYKMASPPATGLKSTVAIDIAVTVAGTDTIVWLATGKGVQFTMDNGVTWLQYNSANGLPSDNVSAIAPIGSRLWVATNHEGSIGNSLATFSDGVTYTDDGGNTWEQIDFGSSGLNIPYVWGGDRTVYDITGARDTNTYQASGGVNTDWAFFTAFAGAFLSSRDGGVHWRRIFPTPGDSIQWNTAGQEPSLRNRYFSCVIDTSHGDSTFVWAGTAGGVFQYVFVQPREKLYSKSFTRVGFCPSCGDSTKSVIGGIGGLSLGKVRGGQFTSRFLQDGLPGNYITAVRDFGGRLFVGTAADSANSTGLAVSDNGGASFSTSGSFSTVISDFAAIRNRMYLAAQSAGLYVSNDTGASWSHLDVNGGSPASLVNTVNAIESYGDTLRVGTDSGLAFIAMDSTGAFASVEYVHFAEDDSTSQRIIRVRTQRFLHDTTGTVDSTAIWTCNLPRTPAGEPMVGRIYTDSLGDLQFYRHQISPPPTPIGSITYDLGFFDDTAIAVGVNGSRISTIGGDPRTDFAIIDSVNASLRLDKDTIRSIEIRGDTVILASNRGLAFSTTRAKKFKIYRPNLDSLSADLVVGHTVINSINGTANRYGLTGDFVPAIARRDMGAGIAEIWFSGRPVDAGVPGMAKTWTDTSGNLTLLSMNQSDFAWNFEFVGNTVFAATNAGLLYHVDDSVGDTSQTWDTLSFVNQLTNDTLIAPGTAVYAVKRRGDFLWVGTGDGTVRVYLNDMGNQKLYTPVDSSTAKDKVYAFPVPFFPAEGDEVDFHFVVDQAGPVTLEIYDFAMNLVARPIDNITYAAGVYPNGSTQGRTWNGRNGKGEVVAVGVYYFKVTLPGGETRWGKLAVLP